MGLNYLNIELKAILTITAGRRIRLGQNNLHENYNYIATMGQKFLLPLQQGK